MSKISQDLEINAQTLVSVIIPFFNAEEFIEEAIESVFVQTYQNWELLLVDDGSTDKSTAHAKIYVQQFPDRVRYFEHGGHENKGSSASRNLGINNALGEYIAFLDADDVWVPYKLEQQEQILSTHPEIAMVYGSALWWYSWTNNLEAKDRDYNQSIEQYIDRPDSVIKPLTLIPIFLKDSMATPCPSCVLVRKQSLVSVASFDSDFLGLYDDFVLYFKICLNQPVFVSSKCWIKYRQHPKSLCQVGIATGAEYHARYFFLNWFEKYLLEKKMTPWIVWQALQRELLPYRYPKFYCITQRLVGSLSRGKELGKNITKKVLRNNFVKWLKLQWRTNGYYPPIGWVRMGDLQRLSPMSSVFGLDRGTPIDRYYIEQFLSTHAADIQGRVLEIGDNTYTQQFGGDQVTHSDVLHAVAGNHQATIIGDLSNADNLPSDSFDCLILTQTLLCIYDLHAVVQTLYRILKPGGFALITIPGISQISRYDMDRWGDYWRFTDTSARKLFEEAFPKENITVETHGNVLVATAFLHGLAVEELSKKELDFQDPDYQVSITVRVVK